MPRLSRACPMEDGPHIELGGDNGVELVECVETRCKRQDGLLKEPREKIRSLEADRDEVSPVGPNEVERMSAVNGCTRSLGGMETLGLLVVARIPDVIVPECVVECMSGTSVSKCVLKCAHSEVCKRHGTWECVR